MLKKYRVYSMKYGGIFILFLSLYALITILHTNPALAQTNNNYLYLNGNVGIGTNNPTSPLSVGTGGTSNFTVDSAGNVTAKGNLNVTGTVTSGGSGSSKPYFIATYAPYQWVPIPYATWTTVPWNTVVATNCGNCFNTSTHQFTAPTSGLYFCQSTPYSYSDASASWTYNAFLCNGSWNCGTSASVVYYQTPIYGPYYNNYATNQLVYLNAGSTLQNYAYSADSSGREFLAQYSQFSCVFMTN